MKTLTVSEDTFNQIVNELKAVKKELVKVKELLSHAPPYGSDEWWEWSIKKSEEDYRNGNYVTLKSKKELQDYLDSLK